MGLMVEAVAGYYREEVVQEYPLTAKQDFANGRIPMMSSLGSAVREMLDIDPELGNAALVACEGLACAGRGVVMPFRDLTTLPVGFSASGSVTLNHSGIRTLPMGMRTGSGMNSPLPTQPM
jgi:hypothetical protein